MSELSDLVESGRLTDASRILEDLTDPEVGRELARLDHAPRSDTFRLLPKDRALAVFEDLDAPLARDILSGLVDETTTTLIADLDPDDRARLLDELPAGLANRLLRGLDDDERAMTETLLGYPDDSAGRNMTPEVATIPERMSAGDAIEHLRRQGQAETIYMVPVVDPTRVLRGVLSLRTLLGADPDAPVTELMARPIAVHTEEDQEVAARLIRDHGMIGLPVVDREERIVGVVTVDDAMRILKEEESEDAARAGGSEPLRRPYLATSVLQVVRARIVWLFVLIAAATLTVNVLDHFEDTLAKVVQLALFIPLLIGTAGNTGTQAVTTVVRAMAVENVGLRDLPRVAGRELSTGLLLGLLMGVVAGTLAAVIVSGRMGVVLLISLVAVCALATTAGACVPLVARRIGIDPAVVSAPVITTLVDATGLVIYFVVARLVLGI